VSPSVGYFVIDRLAAGVSFTVSGAKSKQPGLSQSHFGVSGGPFVRYYFPFGKIAVFPTVSASWGTTKVNTKYNDGFGVQETNQDFKTSRYSGGAGVAWFLASNVALEGIAFYQNYDNDNAKATQILAFNVGLQFFIPSKGAAQSNE
jgi:outer membrane protein